MSGFPVNGLRINGGGVPPVIDEKLKILGIPTRFWKILLDMWLDIQNTSQNQKNSIPRYTKVLLQTHQQAGTPPLIRLGKLKNSDVITSHQIFTKSSKMFYFDDFSLSMQFQCHCEHPNMFFQGAGAT